MGDKKRKESSGAGDAPRKKSKKSKAAHGSKVVDQETIAATTMPITDDADTKSKSVPLPTAAAAAAVSAKAARKRAADFMDDGEGGLASSTVTTKKHKAPATAGTEEPTAKKSKKGSKSKKSKHAELLSADGVNGVIEHSGEEEVGTATTHKPVITSMQAEAEHTLDHELEDEFGSGDNVDEDEVEEEDNAAVLLAGFDSDSEDNQQDKGLDLTSIPPFPADKQTRNKLKKIKKAANQNDEPGTVYVGRIPHGFYELQMKEYFSQFGDISRLRLSRNKRTGASKHFAFIEFKSNEVAKIVASSMDNYLLFGHILKCKYAEPGSLHPDVWKGADKKFRKIPHEKLEREKLAAPKTEEQWQKKVDKEQRRRDQKAKKLQAIGLEMPVSTLTNPAKALQERLANQEEPKQVESADAGPTGMLEPPENIPKDDVAVKQAQKTKKDKKKRKSETNAADEEATAEIVQETPVTEQADIKSAKKDKKKAKRVSVGTADPDTSIVSVQDEAPAVEDAEDAEVKTAKKNKKKNKKADLDADSIVAQPAPESVQDAPAADKTTVKTDAVVAEPKVSKKEKKASKKARESIGEASAEAPAATVVEVTTVETVEIPAAASSEPAAPIEAGADFISLGEFADVSEDKPDKTPATSSKKVLKSYKKEKKKKDRKNLVKARGPKSTLLPTSQKSKPDLTATGKGGLPLLGKGKYDKAKRDAHKELKKQLLAKRGGGGRRRVE
ncbi:nucleolar protein [Exophiala xenobiotica]|nr:nucleolar protein [Exophiala xenobiotica]KAK5203679.1 nucleolar protein [Exophiala xenobiotica]KAK5227872.1 nucleolar protein [Exophiala xenobiotica]KAK5253405.1 nucleolar protein [Exophiala xenobiotica]KAK5317547.1 nucleolar protein [Exophiala xenobiotica]